MLGTRLGIGRCLSWHESMLLNLPCRLESAMCESPTSAYGSVEGFALLRTLTYCSILCSARWSGRIAALASTSFASIDRFDTGQRRGVIYQWAAADGKQLARPCQLINCCRTYVACTVVGRGGPFFDPQRSQLWGILARISLQRAARFRTETSGVIPKAAHKTRSDGICRTSPLQITNGGQAQVGVLLFLESALAEA